jgi:drug/metabolite transporter (DMT)-like permease
LAGGISVALLGGISVALLAALANAFAIVLQATEDRLAPLEHGGRARLLVGLARRPRWLAGTGLMIGAWPLQVLALALAPITVVQPLLASTQLVLLALARVKLREHVGWREILGSLAIVVGVGVVVWAAPRHAVYDVGALRLALPLVGALAALAYLIGRLRRGSTIALVIGAGLAYAWVDFANKLLADDLVGAHWILAGSWLLATVAVGTLAFLEETSALQRRAAVSVAPVIGAVHDPLPVLMALWAGLQTWGSAPHRILALSLGLVGITIGAAALGRSRAVARISGDAEVGTLPNRRLAGAVKRSCPGSCAPGRCLAAAHQAADSR